MSVLKAQLLGETSHLALSIRKLMNSNRGIFLDKAIELATAPVGPAFSQPAYIRQRYAFATPDEISAALKEFARLLGVSDQDSIAFLAQQMIHTFKLDEFRRRLPWIAQRPGEDPLGSAAKRFFAAQVLFDLLAHPLDMDTSYPPLVESVFLDAADGLFEVGRLQFEKLADVICDILQWIQRSSLRRIVVLESPLGNTLPSQVLHDALMSRGIAGGIQEWGCPRNESPSRGLTVKGSATEVASRPEVEAADSIVFMDDALTGTRLSKMARALKSSLPAGRLAVLGMRFKFDAQSGVAPFPQKDIDELNDWATRQGRSYGVADFPPLPLFNVDDEGRVYLEKALCWGDVDIVAGKRKVNLVFNIIDHYENLARALEDQGSVYWSLLDELWSLDATGARHIILPGLSKRVLSQVLHRVGVKWLFREIRTAARSVFPDDYIGRAFAPTELELRKRANWLKQCISDVARRKVSANEAGTLSRAITELHEAALDEAQRTPHRDHAYCHYTLPWNTSIQALNKRLRDKMSLLVEARCPSV